MIKNPKLSDVRNNLLLCNHYFDIDIQALFSAIVPFSMMILKVDSWKGIIKLIQKDEAWLAPFCSRWLLNTYTFIKRDVPYFCSDNFKFFCCIFGVCWIGLNLFDLPGFQQACVPLQVLNIQRLYHWQKSPTSLDVSWQRKLWILQNKVKPITWDNKTLITLLNA